jgi:cell division protein FtsB
MANQQLVDYIKGQLQAGVKDDDIKKVLKDAGWPDAEVLDGMSAAKGPIVSSPVAQAASPLASQTTTQFSAQSGMGASSGMKINAFGGSISSTSPTTVSTSPKVEEKKESVKFDFATSPMGSKSTGETTTFKPQEAKAESFSPVATATSAIATATPATGKKSLLPWILFIVALVALGVAVPMLYMSGLSAKESVTSLQTQLQAAQSQLMSLQGSGADTATQLSALNSEKQDILDELAIFAVPALVPATTATTTSGTSTAPAMQMPASVEFRVKGVITQDSKGVYAITTPRNIVLTVKNSKDSKVDTTLKPMAGQNVAVSFSGVHAPMSKDLTVESVNGVSVK